MAVCEKCYQEPEIDCNASQCGTTGPIFDSHYISCGRCPDDGNPCTKEDCSTSLTIDGHKVGKCLGHQKLDGVTLHDGRVCIDGKPCAPMSCEDLGVECGSASDGCGKTLNCGTCTGLTYCKNGKCISKGAPKLTVVANPDQNHRFKLQWTYTVSSFGGTDDHYELEEATGSPDHFVVTHKTSDLSSPASVVLTRTSPGDYYYRVRAKDSGAWTAYSNAVKVKIEVCNPPCPDGAVCQNGTCECQNGATFDPYIWQCLLGGAECPDGLADSANQGHCVGNHWFVCDPGTNRVIDFDCEAAGCTNVTSGQPPMGGCNCTGGSQCLTIDFIPGTSKWQYELICNTSFGITAVMNCKWYTGSSDGLCSTFVTEMGNQTSCLCDPCRPFLYGQGCTDLCSPSQKCYYEDSGMSFSYCEDF